MNVDFERALEIVSAGGCLVYPTETLYAVGGDGRDARAAARVMAIKGRAPAKPLPLVVGAMEQLSLVTDEISGTLERLAGSFWPGPLSVLVRARAHLPPQVSDERGLTSVRLTPHPLAARLCLAAGAPLIATSANLSGRPATADPARLDPELVRRVDGVLALAPGPSGGAASTVVGAGEDGVLVVHRLGAVSMDALRAAGFRPVPAGS
ncbi:L-threonylcarbamoyladenylate synthase [Desulfocurvus sp. DL9XJH121]